MNLSGISVYHAFAEGLHLTGSTFDGTVFEEGDFSRVNFGGATFLNTRASSCCGSAVLQNTHRLTRPFK